MTVARRSVQGWEPIWAAAGALSDYWRTPEPSVVAWAERLWEAGGRCILDLGCGVGRHTIALAQRGFAVTATDVSLSGIASCAAWLAREGLNADLTCHDMGTLPFASGSFDGLVAYNVIYHATVSKMRCTLAEILRVLCPGGLFYATFIAQKDSRVLDYWSDAEAGTCTEIEPFTFIYLRDPRGDKYLPHHYCDRAELHELLAAFAIEDLQLVRVEYVDDKGEPQIGVHYHVQARR